MSVRFYRVHPLSVYANVFGWTSISCEVFLVFFSLFTNFSSFSDGYSSFFACLKRNTQAVFFRRGREMSLPSYLHSPDSTTTTTSILEIDDGNGRRTFSSTFNSIGFLYSGVNFHIEDNRCHQLPQFASDTNNTGYLFQRTDVYR